MAYVIDDDMAYLRSPRGWREIVLGFTLIPKTPDSHSVSESSKHTEETTQSLGNFIEERPSNSVLHELEEKFTRKELRLAALNDPISGGMRDVASADYACYRQARGAGLRGVFRALLSGPRHEVASLVRHADRHKRIVNLRGEVVLRSWADVVSGSGGQFMERPSIVSFEGKNILDSDHWPSKYIWHGSTRYGEKSSINCNNWSSGAPRSFGLAAPLSEVKLLAQKKMPCDSSLTILCIESTSSLPKRKKREALVNNL